jgi:hypothetical protein
MYYLKTHTRIWIDNVHGNDENDACFTRETALRTPQAAVNRVIQEFHLNNFGIEFFYCWNDDAQGNPIEYPGVIFAYPFLGSAHDYAISLRGEVDAAGSVRVRIADGIAGCIHAAEAAQVYVYDIAGRSFNANVPVYKAAYNGKLFLYNVVAYDAGSSQFEAGPRNSSIDINGPWWVYNTSRDPNYSMAAGLCNVMDGASITSAPNATCSLNGNPKYWFGVMNVGNRGRMEIRNQFSGGARGRHWTNQSDGMFLTGHGHATDPRAAAAGLDAYFPGDTPGASLDGGIWPML